MAVDLRSSNPWVSTANSKWTDGFHGEEHHKKRESERLQSLKSQDEQEKCDEDFYGQLDSLRNTQLLEAFILKYAGWIDDTTTHTKERDYFFKRLNALAKKSSKFNGYLVAELSKTDTEKSEAIKKFAEFFNQFDDNQEAQYPELFVLVNVATSPQIASANDKLQKQLENKSIQKPTFFDALLAPFRKSKEQLVVNAMLRATDDSEKINNIQDLLLLCQNTKLREALDKKLTYTTLFGIKFKKDGQRKELAEKLGLKIDKFNQLLSNNNLAVVKELVLELKQKQIQSTSLLPLPEESSTIIEQEPDILSVSISEKNSNPENLESWQTTTYKEKAVVAEDHVSVSEEESDNDDESTISSSDDSILTTENLQKFASSCSFFVQSNIIKDSTEQKENINVDDNITVSSYSNS